MSLSLRDAWDKISAELQGYTYEDLRLGVMLRVLLFGEWQDETSQIVLDLLRGDSQTAWSNVGVSPHGVLESFVLTKLTTNFTLEDAAEGGRDKDAEDRAWRVILYDSTGDGLDFLIGAMEEMQLISNCKVLYTRVARSGSLKSRTVTIGSAIRWLKVLERRFSKAKKWTQAKIIDILPHVVADLRDQAAIGALFQMSAEKGFRRSKSILTRTFLENTVRLGQFKILSTDGEPREGVCWAWLSPATANAIGKQHLGQLSAFEFNEGLELWITLSCGAPTRIGDVVLDLFQSAASLSSSSQIMPSIGFCMPNEESGGNRRFRFPISELDREKLNSILSMFDANQVEVKNA